MFNRIDKESKLVSSMLRSIKRTAVKSAGIPSLKGAYEKKVPEELKK